MVVGYGMYSSTGMCPKIVSSNAFEQMCGVRERDVAASLRLCWSMWDLGPHLQSFLSQKMCLKNRESRGRLPFPSFSIFCILLSTLVFKATSQEKTRIACCDIFKRASHKMICWFCPPWTSAFFQRQFWFLRTAAGFSAGRARKRFTTRFCLSNERFCRTESDFRRL